MSSRRLVLNATEMATAGHMGYGLWTLQDPARPRYTEAAYWVDLARTLEGAGFDAVFLTDALGQLDVHRGSAEQSLVDAVQTPLDDPLLVAPLIAAVTERLGIAVTVSTTYEQPYLLARKFTTLDHLTGGRIGWNVVTSQLDSAARNLGYDRQVPHDERYARAAELLEVAYKLWEGSWDDDAVVLDRERRVYADPGRVHAIEHRGTYFTVPSAHLSEPSVQRTPLLYQAGSSEAGRAFAARNAEVVFVAGHDPQTLGANIARIRELAVEAGRAPDAIRFLSSAIVVPDATDELARLKLEKYKRHRSVEGAIAHFSAITDHDWGAYDLDAPVTSLVTDSNQSILAALVSRAQRDAGAATLRSIFAGERGIGAYGEAFVGSGETIARELEELADAAGLDGFNVTVGVPTEDYAAFGEHVVPVLRQHGRLPEPSGTTLRERVLGVDSPRLAADHPGSAWRGAFAHHPSSSTRTAPTAVPVAS